jgi:hypothetical protein
MTISKERYFYHSEFENLNERLNFRSLLKSYADHLENHI